MEHDTSTNEINHDDLTAAEEEYPLVHIIQAAFLNKYIHTYILGMCSSSVLVALLSPPSYPPQHGPGPARSHPGWVSVCPDITCLGTARYNYKQQLMTVTVTVYVCMYVCMYVCITLGLFI